MSTTFRPYAPDQSLLLPPDVRAWLAEGHLAHHVSDLVDGFSHDSDVPERCVEPSLQHASLANARYCSALRAAAQAPQTFHVGWDGRNAHEQVHPCPLAAERAVDLRDTEPQADTTGRQPARHTGDEADVPQRPAVVPGGEVTLRGRSYSQANFTAKSSATAINVGEHSCRRPAITLIST